MTEIAQHDVKVAMRDGVRLHTRLYVPDGGPHPVVLRRTPYPWEWMGAGAFDGPNRVMAARGYVIAVQYVRGRFESEGEFEPFHGDVEDAYDSIEWLAAQPWSTGAVGMYGQSYEASTQMAAVLAGHPALKCIVPQAFGSSYANGFPYYSPGILSMGGAIAWAAQVAGEAEADEAAQDEAPAPGSDADTADDSATAEEFGNEIYEMYRAATEVGWHEGLLEMTKQFRDALFPALDERPGRSLSMMSKHAAWWRCWMDADSEPSPYWAGVTVKGRDEVAVPALHISGWLDPFMQPTINRFMDWRRGARTPELRDAQRLVIGPWAHGLSGAPWEGHVEAAPEADLFVHPDIADFQRRWLHDEDGALAHAAPIRIFVMGDNVWHDEWEWPLARTRWTQYYLSGDGTKFASGRLAPTAPTSEEPDRYTFDPRDPVPAVGGAVLPGLVVPGPGQYDQRAVEERPDVLTYSSDPVREDLEVTGPVSVDLWITSSARDTDFTAKLVDVFPTGEAVFVCQGITRPAVELVDGGKLDPSSVYHLTIDLTSTSYVFKTGHAIRVEVSSSCFPLWDVNPNTGGRYASAESTDTEIAEQTIFHDAVRPSHITLPVIPRSETAQQVAPAEAAQEDGP